MQIENPITQFFFKSDFSIEVYTDIQNYKPSQFFQILTKLSANLLKEDPYFHVYQTDKHLLWKSQSVKGST